MKQCLQGHEVKVMMSGAGHYIGTSTEDGMPNCRISFNYYRKREDAQKALDTMNFAERQCMENQYCNCGFGCTILEKEVEK